MTRAAEIRRFGPGELILDAFTQVSVEVFVVLTGRVDLWHDADALGEAADQHLGPGGVFGFSAMLTERSLGPRAVAVDAVTVAAIPESAVEPAFASRQGARFLAAQGAAARSRGGLSSYSLVDEIIETRPLEVDADDPIGEVAAAMTRRGTGYAVVPLEDGRFGLVTDALLRSRVLVEGRQASAPAREVMDASVPTVALGESAAEALILMLDRDAEYLVVTDRGGRLRRRDHAAGLHRLPGHRGGLGARADPPGDHARGAAATGRAGRPPWSTTCCRGAWPPARRSRCTRRSSTRSCGGRSP